jgi:DNA ligase D-like protein (predicted polymerase)
VTVELNVGGRVVRLTNPDREYFPGITKADVGQYFVAVGDGIMNAVRERPTTLERRSGDAPGKPFYQRRIPRGAPDWVETVHLPAHDDIPPADVVCPTELAVVAWLANLGVFTLHPWWVRRPRLDRPDQLWIDLDPQPGTGFGDAVRVALELRAVLAGHGLPLFPKTSGGRGLHLHVPIQPRWSHEEVHGARVALGREAVRRMPRQATMEWSKRNRGTRVYVDCNPPTVASAYSIRSDALVSAPVTWDELDDLDPRELNVRTMPHRFAGTGDLHRRDEAFGIEPLLELT